MNEIIFARICFLCLMGHHDEGWRKAHPSYIDEKSNMLNDGFNAYGLLDRQNQELVKMYFSEWKLELPEVIKEYEKEAIKIIDI